MKLGVTSNLWILISLLVMCSGFVLWLVFFFIFNFNFFFIGFISLWRDNKSRNGWLGKNVAERPDIIADVILSQLDLLFLGHYHIRESINCVPWDTREFLLSASETVAGTLSATVQDTWRQMDWRECLEWAVSHLRLEEVGLFTQEKNPPYGEIFLWKGWWPVLCIRREKKIVRLSGHRGDWCWAIGKKPFSCKARFYKI